MLRYSALEHALDPDHESNRETDGLDSDHTRTDYPYADLPHGRGLGSAQFRVIHRWQSSSFGDRGRSVEKGLEQRTTLPIEGFGPAELDAGRGHQWRGASVVNFFSRAALPAAHRPEAVLAAAVEPERCVATKTMLPWYAGLENGLII